LLVTQKNLYYEMIYEIFKKYINRVFIIILFIDHIYIIYYSEIKLESPIDYEYSINNINQTPCSNFLKNHNKL
jgi:hypothetical protein